MMRATRVVVALVAASFGAMPTAAQDFATPTPPGPSPSPLAIIEGMPAAPARIAIGTAWTRWHGIPDLQTRAVAAAAGARGAVLAAGVSRTGPAEYGWGAAGCALGLTGDVHGISVRAAIRRDVTGAAQAAIGGEAGGAAWVRLGDVDVWARAPQMWSRGEAPPLARPLAVGAAWSGDGLSLWLERSAPARPEDMAGRHALGASLAAGRAIVWLEARDGPPRAGLGVSARAAATGVAVRVDAHPELGETVSIAFTLGGPP